MGSRYELVQCPYDKSHMVQAGRLQHHLIKCRKNHPDVEFATCPFNACHQFLRTELQSHLSRCPDRVWLNEEIHHWSATEPGRIKSGNLAIPDFDVESPKCVEDWDSEENMITGGEVSSYHTHIYHPPQPLRIDTQTDTDTTDQESLPPQPRIFHTAVVSNMKKTQDNNGDGLRLPRHLPRALEQLRNARPMPIPPQESQQGPQTQNPHRYDSNEQSNLSELSKGLSPKNPSSQGPILKVQSSQRQGECHKGHTSQGESSKDQRYQEKCPTIQSSNEKRPHAHGPKRENLETQSMKEQISAAPPIKLAGLGRGLLRPMNVKQIKKPSSLANSPPRPSPTDVAGDREGQTTCRVLPTQTTSEPESCTSDQEVRYPTPRGILDSDQARANQPTGRGRGRGILGLSFCARENTEVDPGVGNRAVSPSLPIFSHKSDGPSSPTNPTGKPRFVIPKVGAYDSPR